MKRKKMFSIFPIVVLATLIFLSSSATFQYPAQGQIQQQKLVMLKTQDHSLNILFKRVENSVVQVTRKLPTLNLQNQQRGNATALGSGILYDTNGHIITNNHVVGAAKIVDVTFIDGNRYTANVVGTDIYNDLAVLKIIGNLTKPVAPLQLGNSSALEVGDQVIAIGNPFGLDDTMTTGIVSQKGRVLPDTTLGFSIPDVIQTDALIDPGNSGGPLLNMQGQVIGINTAAIISDSGGFSGIGLAISSNTAKRIVPILIDKGNYTHPYLGLTGATLTSDSAGSVSGLEPNFQGILVDSIVKGGAVDKAGLHGSTTDQFGKKHGGDIISAVDSLQTKRMEDLISYVEGHKSVGDKIVLSVFRNGQTLNLQAVLQQRPSPPPYLKSPTAPILP
ncbi:MAG TPA: trypsin-like peptidase domain-containing protein [Candidatus Acidoferrum sp.]|nr:trypsin-like peptidase domain-containing protein [Candidatus Acidoferrum sp.]